MPCDPGGLAACLYWRTHDASPGEPVAWGDLQALDLYQQIQRHGWELVSTLRTLRLTEQEAEALFVRLDWLQMHLPELIAQWRGEGIQEGASSNGYAHRRS